MADAVELEEGEYSGMDTSPSSTTTSLIGSCDRTPPNIPVGSLAFAALTRGRLFSNQNVLSFEELMSLPPPPMINTSNTFSWKLDKKNGDNSGRTQQGKESPMSQEPSPALEKTSLDENNNSGMAEVLLRANEILKHIGEAFDCDVWTKIARSEMDGCTYLVVGFSGLPSSIFGGRLKLLPDDYEHPPMEAHFMVVRTQFLVSFRWILPACMFNRILVAVDGYSCSNWTRSFLSSPSFRECAKTCLAVLSKKTWLPLFLQPSEDWDPFDQRLNKLRSELFDALEGESRKFWSPLRVSIFLNPAWPHEDNTK